MFFRKSRISPVTAAAELAQALDVFWERYVVNQIDLTAADARLALVQSGCPEGWQELWDRSEHDADNQQRFNQFVSLIDSDHRAERWLTGTGKRRS